MRSEKPIPDGFFILASLTAGFTAFVFLLAWTGMLPEVFGSPALTDGWVPLSFLGGAAAGLVYFGRKGRLVTSARRMFSVTLFAFGVAGLPVLQLLKATGGVPDALIGSGITSTGVLTAVLAAATFCILFIPGFLLGGILAFGGARSVSGGHGSRLALWPLFIGLAAGAVILVFVMLPHLGYAHCVAVAAALASVTGLAGIILSGRTYQGEVLPETTPDLQLPASRVAVFRTVHVFLVVTWALLWLRLLLITMGPTIQALAAVLATLFTGLAVGSLLCRLLKPRRANAGPGTAVVAGASAILLLYLGRSAGALPSLFLEAVGNLPLVWADLLRAYVALAFLIMFTPFLLLGMFVQMALLADSRPTRAVSVLAGFVLAALGAVLVTRFLPVESVPTRSLIVVLPWITLASAFGLLLTRGRGLGRRPAWASLAVITLVMAVLSANQPRWMPALLARGIYGLPIEFKRVEDVSEVLSTAGFLLHLDEPGGIVSVERDPDARTLRVNGIVRASAERGMTPYLLAGHIPMLLHVDPHRVFIDGVGAGLTLEAVETYPVEEIHCAEPSKAVVRAAGLFSPYNGDALEDGRLIIRNASTRNDLLLSDNRYDVIVLNSPPPYSFSSAERMTVDFFSLARSRLTPGGVLCQHVRTFHLASKSFRSMAKSFAYLFPHVTVWWVGDDDVLLLGGSRPFTFPEEAVRDRMALPSVTKDLARLRIGDPLGILSCFVMRRDSLMDLCGAADILTLDSNSLLIEWAERTIHLVRTDVLEDLDSADENPVVLIPGLDRDSVEYKLLRDRLGRCRTARGFSVKSLVAMREGRIREAVSLYAEAPTLCPMNGVFLQGLADYYMVLSKSMVGSNRIEEAVEAARRAVELLPQSPRTYYNLAAIELKRDPSTAVALLDRAIAMNPYYVPAYLLKAKTQLATGEAKEAAETVGRVLPMEPFNIEAHHIRGLSFVQRRMYAEGRSELELVLEAEPFNTDAIDALAYSWLVENELDKAEGLYERLLEIDPDHLGALNNYATILAEKGRYREAITTWTRALEMSPGNQDIIDNIEEARQSMRR